MSDTGSIGLFELAIT